MNKPGMPQYEIEIAKDNAAYPVRLTLHMNGERVVEVYFSPADADRLGRRMIEKAAKSLETWRPTA